MEIKKFITSILIIANIGLTQAQYTAIPDNCFEQHLINLGIDSEGTLDGQVLTTDITNITELSVSGVDINGNDYECYIDSLQGIDAFTALETLDVSTNGIQHLNVSNLSNLKNLYCDYNFMLTLDLPTSIEIVYARHNRFSQNIDFSQTINLIEVHLDGFWDTDESHITEINVSNSPNLIELTASFNDLVSIDTSNNPLLEVLTFTEMQYYNYSLTSFTHNNPNLKTLRLYGNLTSLDVSEMVNLEHLQVVGNSIPTLNLTNNIELLEFRYGDDNTTTEIDMRNGNNTNLMYFAVGNTPNLSCIYVDNAQYSQDNWLYIDNNTTFVETEVECEALAINDITIENQIFVYPNPVKNIINIKIDNNEIKKIMICDFLGKIVLETNKNKIDFSNNQEGIYFVKIITKKGVSINKKIIKIGA